MNAIKLTLLFLLVPLLASELAAQTGFPRFSIQGTLKDGMSMAIPDGTYSLKFKLFDAPTGGAVVWEEVADVEITGGLYSYLLGSVNPLIPSIFAQTLYVGVEAEGYDFLPRTELTYSPSAMYVHLAGNGFPAGAVIPYPSATLPSGWLLCNGQALSSVSFPALYAAIGTTYGNGSGGINGGAGKNFNVPDLRGEFVRGLDSGRGIDSGRALGTAQESATTAPNSPFTGTTSSAGAHTHVMTSQFIFQSSLGFPAHYHNLSNVLAFGPTGGGTTGTGSTWDAGAHTHEVTITGGGDAETRPRNISMNYIIKY